MAQMDPSDWLREGMSMWRGMVPNIAEPMTAGMIQLADVFGLSPANMFSEVVKAARAELSGRPIEIDLGTSRVGLVLDDITADTHSLGPAVGQFGDVTLTAHTVRFHGVDIDQAAIVLKNVHLRPGPQMQAVAAPIEVTAVLSEPAVNQLLADRGLGVTMELANGVPRVRLASRPNLGHLEVEITPAVDHVIIAATAAANDRWRFEKAAKRLPRFRFDLPRELTGTITSIEPVEDRLVVSGHFPELREPVSREQIDQMLLRVQNFTGDMLRLPRL